MSMKKLFLLLLLIPFITAAHAQNTTKKAVKSAEKILVEDDKGKGQGGKQSNPGAHGRANAEMKKATNPGQGSGKKKGLSVELLDEKTDGKDKDKKDKDKKDKDKKGDKKDGKKK